MSQPIVLVSSYPPRLCGIGRFAEEAREFIQKANPGRDVLVVSHTDGRGEGVSPLIDLNRSDWWRPVSARIREVNPYAVHLQHEYGLYNYVDRRGSGDENQGFLTLLEALRDLPTVVEPHTVHGRLRDAEANFVHQLCDRADVVLFKCHYQKWRLDWSFSGHGWKTPRSIMVVPHGARPDRRWAPEDVPALREKLGMNEHGLSKHLVGMIGWIQSNKRWDILLSMWEELRQEIHARSGVEWDLLAAGTVRDEHHRADFERWRSGLLELQNKKMAHFHEFIPRGDAYYELMAICDFVVLPSTDETQSGTLARIIALNKPFITTAPMEGLTAQTLESEGGLLFTNKAMLRKQTLLLACDEELRMRLGGNLRRYLDEVVSWEVVARQYNQAYELARDAQRTGRGVEIEDEF